MSCLWKKIAKIYFMKQANKHRKVIINQIIHLIECKL